MIAATRRMATHDFLLVVFSAIVLLLANWPSQPPRQVVAFRDASGTFQQYSFAADDPRLAKLRSELAKRSGPLPNSSLAVARWRAELADFYAARTETKGEPTEKVIRVSFTDGQRAQHDADELSRLRAQHEFWVRAGEKAREGIAEVQAAIKQRQLLSEPPPIVFGNLTSGGHPPGAFIVATLIGVCLASGLALWTYVSPAIVLATEVNSPELRLSQSANHDQARELRLVIPARWVRVHQPLSVILRRCVSTAIIAGGLVSVIL